MAKQEFTSVLSGDDISAFTVQAIDAGCTYEQLARDLEQVVLARTAASEHQIIAAFLERSDQWLTNDATHDAYGRQVRGEALEEAAAECDAKALRNEEATGQDGDDTDTALRAAAWQMSVLGRRIRALKPSPAPSRTEHAAVDLRPHLEWALRRIEVSLTQGDHYAAAHAALDASRSVPAAAVANSKPVATVESWTNGSYWRNYQLKWHQDVDAGTQLFAFPIRAPGQPSTNPGPLAAVEELTDAARDVLAERHRQVFREDYTHDHDDEHVNDEIAALACFYAMPPGARDWDASSTGYVATLGDAILPPDWHTSTGNRRRELVKAGALIIADLERLDRAAIAASKEGAFHG